MYLYQPCLLTLALYVWAWEKDRRFRILLPLVILLASEWELILGRIWLYPAAMLLPVMFLTKRPSVAWAEVLTSSILGGLLCWKAADRWPLLPGRMLLCAALLIIPALFLCRGREARLLACALGSLLYELFFCLREYVLFSFCTIRLGSREELSLGTAAVCLYLATEQVLLAVRTKKLTESKKSACIFRSDVYN